LTTILRPDHFTILTDNLSGTEEFYEKMVVSQFEIYGFQSDALHMTWCDTICHL